MANLWRAAVVVAMLVIEPGVAVGSDREDVTFSISQTTQFGQSVFVLGDLPELGGNDLRLAVKLEPSTYPVWKATVSLPVNTTYSYRFYLRNDAAGQWGNAGNGTALGSGPIGGSTGSLPLSPASKTVFAHSSFDPPVLWWRATGSGSYQSIVMYEVGPGRSAGEKRWAARGFGKARQSIEVFLSNQSFTHFDPADNSRFTTTMDTFFVQGGHAFAYVPPATVSGPVKRYSALGSPPTTSSTTLFSVALGETRSYRVITPRGYNEQPERRYPVLYFHDGQNVFEQGSFGTWNADETAERMIRLGQLREVILVGADHGPNRLSDYAAPDNGGRANLYAQFLIGELMPVVNAQYRTLSGVTNTAAAGSSMGGQVSMYLGWDFAGTFGRVGAFSGAWDVFTSAFRTRFTGQPRRNLRIYLDSGDSGTASDGFWTTVGIRDNLINPSRAGGVGGAYVLERDLRHVYGPFQQHNESAWAARLPQCYEFLFPAAEAPNELAGQPSARQADVNDDDCVNIEDLYAWEQGMPGLRSTLDVDRDGVLDSALDGAALRGMLRAGEAGEILVQ